MSLIFIRTKSKKANRKPGWQRAEQEHADRLARAQSQTLFNPTAKPKRQRALRTISPIADSAVDRASAHVPSRVTIGDTSTKAVLRPELTYRDNPELLARELAARERKFNAAPAYNKGGDVFMTDEMMNEIVKTGGNRRRG